MKLELRPSQLTQSSLFLFFALSSFLFFGLLIGFLAGYAVRKEWNLKRQVCVYKANKPQDRMDSNTEKHWGKEFACCEGMMLIALDDVEAEKMHGRVSKL